MAERKFPTDDKKPWGFITEAGEWVELPKTPMLLAGLGPPPFHVKLPSGDMRHVVHAPDRRQMELGENGAGIATGSEV